jgi:hypothetical protein
VGRTRAWITLLATMLVLSACGPPEFTYVRDRGGTTYFKVPASFAQIDASSLDLALSGNRPDTQAALLRARRVWATAFDQAPQPAIDHLFDSRAPFVYATVHRLTEEQRATVSLDRLRDFILPVTEEMRTAYLTRALSSGRTPLFTGFEPISDRLVLLDNGARGVRVRFNYRIGATVQTFDHTAILDERGGTVSVMLITCRSSCFAARGAEFEEIAGSFKLLRLRG